MTKRIITFCMCAVVCLSLVHSELLASNRQTPAVMAVKRAMPSIVNIHSEKTARDGGTLFTKGRKVNGMGTGIVVDERGYIVTNYHVVADVDSLRVTTYDGAAYDAQVVSYDRDEDLAIIQVSASGPMPTMPLGTSSDLMLGETVLAIGNAFGYTDSVTGGMVSSLSRNVEVNEKQSYKNLIQTDASINPGNSGGPLVNLDGEVIGINVAIRANAQRIGFAIPIDNARRIIAQLLSIEHLCSTQHGLIGEDVKKGKLQEFRCKSARSGSPAEAAGLIAGDLITKVGSVKVTDAADFERACLGQTAGTTLEIQIERKGVPQTLKMELAALSGRPSQQIARPTQQPPTPVVKIRPAERTWSMFGVRLEKLDNGERYLVGTKYRGGLRVTGVREKSPAFKNGIKEGDILVGLHLWETVNFDNVSYVLDHPQLSTFNPLKFYILRGGETLYGHVQIAHTVK
ncbi:MAG: serine protease [Planctomycetaceae bacterium]|nr:serine protease [Planctomycetaceae bacterium]